MNILVIFILLSIISSQSNNGDKEGQVVFIYNAKSGLVNGMFDYVHKFVSPSTYECNLCSITYDMGGKKDQWVVYLNTLPLEVKFAYKDNIFNDEFNIDYNDETLPCAFLITGETQSLILSSTEIGKMKTLDELKTLLSLKFIDYGVRIKGN